MPDEDWDSVSAPAQPTTDWDSVSTPAPKWEEVSGKAAPTKLSPWQAAWEGAKSAGKNVLGMTPDEEADKPSGPADDTLGVVGNLSDEFAKKATTPMEILSTLGRGFRTPLHTMLNPGAMMPQILENTPNVSSPLARAALGSTVGLGTTMFKNMFLTPDAAPTGPQIVQDVADRGQDAVHSLFHLPDSPRINTRALSEAKVYDKEGYADWSRVPAKLLGGLIDMGSDIGTDPGQLALMGVHPGVSPTFEAGTVAARDAVRSGELGKFASEPRGWKTPTFVRDLEVAKDGTPREGFGGKWVFPDDATPQPQRFSTLQEAEQAMKGRFSDAVAAGQAGVNLKVPFGGPEIGFKQVIPKAFAPAFQALEPITDYLAKPLIGPNPKSPQELLKVQKEGRARQKVMTFMRDNLAPVEEQVAKAGFTDETMLHAGSAVEAFDQDGNLRTSTVPDNSPMDLNAQAGFPKELAADFEELAKNRSDIHAEVKKQYEAGAEHLTPQLEAAYKHASTLTPTQQATFWDVAQKTAKVMHDTLAFMKQNGLDVDTINAPVKALPRKLFDTIKAIEPETYTSNKTINAFRTQVGDVPLTSKVRPAVKALYDAVRQDGFSTNELGKMLDDVRFDKHPETWQGTDYSQTAGKSYKFGEKPDEAAYGRFDRYTPADKLNTMAADVPETLRTPETMANELSTGRMKRQANAAQRATGAVNEFETLKELNPAERQYLVNKLYEKLPQAMKQYNAVPRYRPGMISQLTREEINTGVNPNLKRQGGAMNPEQAKRSGTLAGMDKKYADMGDVKMSVTEGMEQYAKGTEATYGRALTTAGNWWDRFMTKTGMREIQASGGREFFEPNPLKAIRHQLEPVARAITNEGLDAEMLRLYDLVPDDLKETANRLLHDGVETGKEDVAQPQYSHSKKGALIHEPMSKGAKDFVQPEPVLGPETQPKPPHTPTGKVFDPQDPFQRRPDPFAPPRKPQAAPDYGIGDQPIENAPQPAPEEGWFHETREGPGKNVTLADLEQERASAVSEWEKTGSRQRLDAINKKIADFKKGPAPKPQKAPSAPTTPPKSGKPATIRGFDPLLDDPLKPAEGPRSEPLRATGDKLKYAPTTEEVSATRPATLADMEELWKKSGRTDKFADHLNDTAKDALTSGKTLQEAVGSQWQPADRAYVELGDQKGWIHTGVANDLAAYKRLGSDPTTFTNFLRRNVPAYVQFVKMSKALATLWGPGAPGYVALKTAHDLVRGEIGGAWDNLSAGEIARGQAGHWRYADTGGMDVSGLPEYDFGPKLGRQSGAAAAEILERNRALGSSGEVAQEFQRGQTEASRAAAAPESSLDLGDYGTSKPTDLATAGRKMENFIRGQDGGMRSAALASYLRQGMTEGEAAFQVERAFFDFTRKGTVPQILGQSGIVPFAAWHFKIMPFMLDWAMKNPGEFMLVQRVLTEMGAGAIPPSQVPMYIQNGTNIPVSVWKDENGHVHMGMLTDEGVVPGNELRHFWNDPTGFFLHKLGPALRALFVASEQAKMEAKDPEKVTWGDWAKKYGQAVGGRPVTIAKTLADPNKTGGEKASMVFNPMQYETFDATKQSQISTATAQRNVKYANFAIGDANKAVREAEAKASDKTKTMSQVEALQFLQSDPTYIDATNELNKAKAQLAREKAYRQKIQQDVKQAKRVRDSMVLAP